MRAVRLHGIGDLRVEQVPEPGAPPAGGVLLKVRAAGICGSDLHNYRTGQWFSRLPSTPGHEFCAEVLATGAGVQGLTPGDLVVADSRVNCGTCVDCLAGRPNVCARMGYVGEVCDGGFAERCVLPAERLLRVPAGVEPSVAALAEPLGVALHAIRRLDAPRDAPILITGAGPVGGLAAILLAHLGFGPIAIVERNAQRAQLVADVCGARVIDASTDAVAAFAGPVGLRHALEATGAAPVLDFVIGVLAGGGRVALVGLYKGQPAVNVNAIVEREIEMRGCSVFCEEQREAIALIPQIHAQLQRVISPMVTLEDLPGEYERLVAGQSGYLKSIVCP